MRFIQRISFSLFLLTLLLLTSTATATIIRVPQDQATIQAGIDAAVHGDTVLVDTGTYVETINFSGKNILVGSLFLTTRDTSYISKTVIDGDSSGHVVTFENGEDSSAVLNGFTLTNSFLAWGIYCFQSNPSFRNLSISNNRGGGLYCKGCNLSVSSSLIRNNWSEKEGAGILADSSNVHLADVEISGNLSTTSGGGIFARGSMLFLKDTRVFNNEAWEGSGGGIYLESSDLQFHGGSTSGNNAFFSGGGIVSRNSKAVFDSVSVMENRSDYGGGGLLAYNSDIVFKNGWVADNIADFSSGGGFLCGDTRLTVERSAVVYNDAAGDGGAIVVYTTLESTQGLDYLSPLLLNVTITGNIASRGGGLFCSNAVHPFVVNSILWDNASEEIAFDDAAYWSSAVTVTHSDLLGGRDSILATERDSVFWLEGNMDVDPHFVDAENDDFSLLEGSPAINAGTTFFVWEGDTLVNLPHNAYEGNAPDMGAVESPYSISIVTGNAVPVKFALDQNYPNPFNPATTIEFSVPQSGLVILTVYDLLGRKIETILHQHVDAGHHQVQWNASNIPSGIYLVKMQAGDPSTSSGQVFTQARKVTVLR